MHVVPLSWVSESIELKQRLREAFCDPLPFMSGDMPFVYVSIVELDMNMATVLFLCMLAREYANHVCDAKHVCGYC
jgi:hypothetical protein